jgi:tetratricopeptide (TPR) repeat protein
MLKTLRILCYLCVFLWAVEARAQPKTPNPPNAPSTREEAAKKYQEAETSYKLQKYQEALEGFNASYALSNEPSILFNIAQCYRLLGRLEESKKTYLTFIREMPNSPLRANAEARVSEVEAEIKRLASKGSIVISSKQDPAEVFLDGESKGQSPNYPERD